MNEYNLFAGDPGYLGKDLARTDAVTVASAKAMAVKWLDPAHRVVITVLPKGGK